MAGRIDLLEAPQGANSENENSDHQGSVTGLKRSRKKQMPALSESLPVIDFPPLEQRPCFSVYETPFQNRGRKYQAGVYDHGYTKEKDEETGTITEVPHSTWILSVLKVISIIRNDSGKEHGYLIEYVEHGKASVRREVLSQSLLLGRPEDALRTLRDYGVSVLHKHAKRVRDYLDEQHMKFGVGTPNDFWRSVKVVGWAPAPTCFVLPTEVIGEQTGVWFNGRGDVAQYGRSGELAQWQSKVASLCEGNSYLILALSSSFAGPILELLNIPGLGLHYFGDSTTGKSSALAVASSAWGPPKFMLSWRSTVNGLESQAASRSGTLTPLDESHMIEAKHLDAGIYMLLNGVAKARMNRDASAKEIVRWRVCVLSSGERSLESNLASAQIDHKAGQGVRIIDLPVTGSFGLFDDLHGAVSGSVFADSLRDAAGEYYGVAGPTFVSRLIQTLPDLHLQTQLAHISKAFGDDLNPQETRVARSFALITLAGEFAVTWGVLPWETGCVQAAAVQIFKHWRSSQPKSSKSREHAQILERISDFIDKHGAARFSNISWTPTANKFGGFDDQPIVHNQAGFWEDSGDSRTYLFTSGGLKEATNGFDLNRVLKALDEAGAFTKRGSAGEKAKNRSTPDGRQIRLYHIDPMKLKPAAAI